MSIFDEEFHVFGNVYVHNYRSVVLNVVQQSLQVFLFELQFFEPLLQLWFCRKMLFL